jgi:hypothetical protein
MRASMGFYCCVSELHRSVLGMPVRQPSCWSPRIEISPAHASPRTRNEARRISVHGAAAGCSGPRSDAAAAAGGGAGGVALLMVMAGRDEGGGGGGVAAPECGQGSLRALNFMKFEYFYAINKIQSAAL